MRIFIEFLCRFVFRELVAWKEVNEFVEDIQKINRFTEDELWKTRLVGYFSGFIHRNQKRSDGSKYITHPLAVARNLVFVLKIFNINMILAAIMHDNAEDSGWSWGLIFFLIEILTNGLVAIWVFFLSKHHNVFFRQFYFEMQQLLRDLCIIIEKLSDRIHNLMTLEFMPLESQRRKLLETAKYFPIFLKIIREDVLLEKNRDLAKSIDDVEYFADRCEQVFWNSFNHAYRRYLEMGGEPILEFNKDYAT